jgi:hypothetical protein
MQNQIRLRLDSRDIFDLVEGKVLYKDEDGRPLGTGATFTSGEHPVEICLSEGDRQPLRNLIFRREGQQRL